MTENGNGLKNAWRIIFLLSTLLSSESGYILKGLTTQSPYAVERGAIQQSLTNQASALQDLKVEVDTMRDEQIKQGEQISSIKETLKLNK